MSEQNKKIDDGGPAFPLDVSKGDNWTFNTGMSVRMVIAKDVLARMAGAWFSSPSRNKEPNVYKMSQEALRFADALILEVEDLDPD